MGRLFVVATPIGNLADISQRALDVLASVDRILCEDTRRTGRLLSHYEIDTALRSYHDHNKEEVTAQTLSRLEGGAEVALVSDAGTPTVADPGFLLVRAARERGIAVVPIPGPSAVLAALSVSGLPTDRFSFLGYYPRKEKAQHQLIEFLAVAGETAVIFESPHRVGATLKQLAGRFPTRKAVMARELTKMHEEIVDGELETLAAQFSPSKGKEGERLRGEITLLLEGARRRDLPENLAEDFYRELVDLFLAHGFERSQALKRAAAACDLPRRTLYSILFVDGE